MKTLSILRWRIVSFSAGFVALCLFSPSALAGPGGGGATAGAAGGGAAVGGMGGGGGRGASVGGGGRAMGGGISPGQHVGAAFGGNAGAVRSISPGFANGAGFSGTRFGGISGAGQLTSPNFNSLSHPVYGNGQVANTGIASYRNGVPTYTRRFDGGSGVPRVGDARYARSQPIYRTGLPVRNNAWTDPRTSRVSPAARIGAADRVNRAYDPGQTYLQNGGLTPGQHLYPGASDYSALSAAHQRPWQEGYRDRNGYRDGRDHYRQDCSYLYGGFFYPYFFGGFYPGYYGGLDYGYGDGLGLYSPYSANVTSGNPDNNVNGTNGGYDQGAGEVARDPYNDPQLPAEQPQVGPAGPNPETRSSSTENGPDSLVEAVQGELVTQGYLPGPADGMYGNATREALRRFQTDQKLSPTGRINEATLHALKLD